MCNFDRPGVMERAVSAVSQDIQRYSTYLHKLLTFAFDKKDGNFSVHFLVDYCNFCFEFEFTDSETGSMYFAESRSGSLMLPNLDPYYKIVKIF